MEREEGAAGAFVRTPHANIARWRRSVGYPDSLRRADMYEKLKFDTKQDKKLLKEIEEELKEENGQKTN